MRLEASARSRSRPGAVLAARLRERSEEIERAILARVEAIADTEIGDADYLLGLRASVHVALEYALQALEKGEQGAGLPPDELLVQARRAARNGIGLETVLRRYLAGHTVLLNLVIREAAAERSLRQALQGLLRTQATVVDRLLAAVAEEHSRAVASLRTDGSAAARHLRAIERLLDGGDPGLAPELRYDFGGHQLALLASGPDVAESLRRLASALDRVLLLATPADQPTVWAWLGGRDPLAAQEALAAVTARRGPEVRIAVGEPGEGIAGWRQSHQQARAAWPIAESGPEPAVRYADVALPASMLQDELLTESLQKVYLEPLEAERDGGETLRGTLRAYFAAERSAASAAAALGVSRQAVNRRLRTAERRLGRPVSRCAPELEAALQMGELMKHPPVLT